MATACHGRLAAEAEVGFAGRLAAMFKSPAWEKKKTSRALCLAVPTPPRWRAARRAGLPPPPLEVGRIARYPYSL